MTSHLSLLPSWQPHTYPHHTLNASISQWVHKKNTTSYIILPSNLDSHLHIQLNLKPHLNSTWNVVTAPARYIALSHKSAFTTSSFGRWPQQTPQTAPQPSFQKHHFNTTKKIRSALFQTHLYSQRPPILAITVICFLIPTCSKVLRDCRNQRIYEYSERLTGCKSL